MTSLEIENIVEAALLTAPQPLSDKALRRLFSPEIPQDRLNDALDALEKRWENRALVLAQTPQGRQFVAQESVVRLIPHLYAEKTPRYSRALMETLAVIAYRQPVTRADIESIRGVTVSSQIMQTLGDRGWIEIVGHKDAPGRPALWGTTRRFLLDLKLRTLADLPPVAAADADALFLADNLPPQGAPQP